MKAARQSEAGFTLIELLCVIAILLILVALLLPFISNALAEAKKVHCLANLRSLTAAHLLYAGSHDGRLCSSSAYLSGSNWVGAFMRACDATTRAAMPPPAARAHGPRSPGTSASN
jgi:prepilin-type N-terminal cleavage/methylation domain-containing protein